MLTKLFHSLRSDGFVRNSLILFVFSALGSAANYVYQIYANRNLSPDDYGLLNAILSLTIIAAVVGDIIRQWITKSYSEIYAFKNHTQLRPVSVYFLKVVALLLAVLVALTLIGAGVFPALVKADSPVGLLYLFLITALGYLAILPGAFLDSFHEFFLRSWLGFVSVLFKLGMLFLFISLGFNMEKALLAHLLGGLAYLVLLFLGARYVVVRLSRLTAVGTAAEGVVPEIKKVSDQGRILFFKIGLASIFLTLLTNMDMTLARLVLDPHDSGIYATSSTFGKAVFFLAVVTQPLFFVSVNDAYNRGQSYVPVLMKSLIFVGLIGLGGMVGLWLFIKPFVSFLNPAYTESIIQILWFSVSILPYIFIQFFATFFVSVNRYRVFGFLMVLLFLQAGLLYFFGRETDGFIQIRLITGLVILGAMVLYFVFRRNDFVGRKVL